MNARLEANGRYILNASGEPEPCPSLRTWAEWFEQEAHRRVADDIAGRVRISTVFLGLDHAIGNGPPLLYETMIFGGPHDEYQERYTSKADALTGHAKAVALVQGTKS